MNEDEAIAIIASNLLAPRLNSHGDANSNKKEQLMQEAIGDARMLLKLSRELTLR